jgi:Tfp pilus assembly protein PilF
MHEIEPQRRLDMAFRIQRLAALAAVLLLAVGAAPAAAQDWAGKGRLQGVVTNENSQPIQGARITLARGEDGKGGGPAPLTTDAQGRWSHLGLAGGAWQITIELPGYVTSQGTAQVNEFGPVPPITIQLRPIPAQQPAGGGTGGATREEMLAWIEKGNALLKEKKYAEARTEYERVLAQLPAENQPPLLRGIATTYYEEDNLDQAVATLKKAVEIKPDDAELLQLLVNWLVAADREEEAKTYMARLPQGTKIDPNSLLNLGIKAYNEKKLDEAAGYFDRVVREYPDLPEGYYYRGLVALAQNKSDVAKADFQKLLEIAPDHAKAAEVKEYLAAL